MRPGRGATGRPYLGYRGPDFEVPFARFFEPEMAPLSDRTVAALALGPQSPELFAPVGEAGALLDVGNQLVETGYARMADGSLCVSVLTPMPGVSPAMWDWWFGWHGSDDRRYKLWHPRAHRSARWQDGGDAGRRGRERYVGRTSLVDEYIGSTRASATIAFGDPAGFGLDPAALADPGVQTAICARVGSSQLPVDIGYLIHHVRAVDGGAEMRSRFWMGGAHVALRSGHASLDRSLSPVLSRVARPPVQRAAELLVHCAQEMTHLAGFLPELFTALGAE